MTDWNAWPDDVVEALRLHWKAGLSASQIAAAIKADLGVAKTRNAVIGKCGRLGLSGPESPHAQRLSKRTTTIKRPTASAPRRFSGPVVVGSSAAAPAPPPSPRVCKVGDYWPIPLTAKTTLQLAPRDCRFPVGEATGMDQLHCGAATSEDECYCADHRRETGGRRVSPSHNPYARAKLPRWVFR